MTFDEIVALIDRIDESSLSEVRVSDGDQTVVLRRGAGGTATANGAAAAHAAVVQGSEQVVAAPATAAAPPAGAVTAPFGVHQAGAAAGAPTGAGVPVPADDGQGAAQEPDLEAITSPIVGTFYRAAAPDSPPFVEEGTEVKEGDTLCIIEAMKVMNELEADFDLRVESILIENGEMVEYGTPILQVRRL